MTVEDPIESSPDSKLLKWKSKLQNQTELVLPTDYPRLIPHRIVEAETKIDIQESTSLAILQLSLQIGASGLANGQVQAGSVPSPFIILLSAFTVLLHRYTGEQDISVGSSSSSTNPLVLRMDINESDTMIDVIKKVVETEAEAHLNEVSFADLTRALTRPDQEHQPTFFKVNFFNLTDTNSDTIAQSYNCDLTVFISQKPTSRRILPIEIRVVYNSLLFSETRVCDMLDQLEVVLKDVNKPISQVSLVTDRMREVLPDPMSNLNWDNYEGSICDILHQTALKKPNARFIVEDDGKERIFSYKQIEDASNVVANSLLENGIQREDVVVLFSFRGVDLVVAVMGVLKAGATFSVIDPAYPPERQIVYLGVARPKGLIVFQKAGGLAAKVSEFIEQELDIKYMINSLQIQDNGDITSQKGLSHNKEFPNVKIGPDSVATLSFTSGSTGLPKGVRGRHFSLTHFYPWMSLEFSLNASDRFTMLSGIAHDPIQRDIFTPIFFGAELHIPTANDIGTPGRLAQWMSQHEITITHLTPAMGQLLSANATHFITSLKTAFFVGDVLTKRDVNRLQYLAPNCYIVNMYGTTETQRAVSFLKIPPSTVNPGFLSQQKDIMSAGKGMKNVQLLVVNKSGLLCGVGEVGEIYVRSGGLAEGYLNLPQVSESKFLVNFFNKSKITKTKDWEYYKGPRDRMYRTGDLGRYLPDGSVECTGRADDQVKIRGFRIELGEIDTHLSQFAKIRENVTLVRRDKDEEQTLVCYFVPFEPATDSLVKEIRDFLKLKLPSYAIPSVFVPLVKMPLTPNGKIDKNSLPFPDTVLTKTVVETDITISEERIRDIWATLLNRPAKSISIDDSFFDIGGHSVLATRLVFSIRTKLSVNLPLNAIYADSTIRGIAKQVDLMRQYDIVVEKEPDFDYAKYVDELDLPDEIKGADTFEFPDMKKAVFLLTGVTGFLGAFILSTLLQRYPQSRVLCLVRSKDAESGFKRIVETSKRWLVWRNEWEDRVEAIAGDLALPYLGMGKESFVAFSGLVDVIVHNGALVHWVYPYDKLANANVNSTVELLKFACLNKTKPLHFVSSTSVLDTSYYTGKIGLAGDEGLVLESDDLSGSRNGLRSGYAQTKWVSEQLLLRARARKVPVTIIRPGYIVGDTINGVGNTDDFLWRLVKGCIELGKVPKISNIVNMCPVDYVATLVASVCSSKENLNQVYHAWHPHQFKFDDLFNQVAAYYPVEPTEYIHWRTLLLELTLSSTEHTLYPLLHFVLDDLPTSTRSPELSDKNALKVCAIDQQVSENQQTQLLWKCPDVKDFVQLYLGYLVKVGFLQESKNELPYRKEWDSVVGFGGLGRSGV